MLAVASFPKTICIAISSMKEVKIEDNEMVGKFIHRLSKMVRLGISNSREVDEHDGPKCAMLWFAKDRGTYSLRTVKTEYETGILTLSATYKHYRVNSLISQTWWALAPRHSFYQDELHSHLHEHATNVSVREWPHHFWLSSEKPSLLPHQPFAKWSAHKEIKWMTWAFRQTTDFWEQRSVLRNDFSGVDEPSEASV